jgi:hypothetical protein
MRLYRAAHEQGWLVNPVEVDTRHSGMSQATGTLPKRLLNQT